MATNGSGEPAPNAVNGVGQGSHANGTTGGLEIQCGPLLNYKHTSNGNTDTPSWHGSVLIVTTPGQAPPELQLRGQGSSSSARSFNPDRLYEDSARAFWRYRIDVPFQEHDSAWEYSIQQLGMNKTFHVPSKKQSMRIMFHSCNGFSVGTDIAAYGGGPVVWEDVLSMPLHPDLAQLHH
jgi:hypothetical protein